MLRVHVGTEYMTARAEHVVVRFNDSVMSLRQEWLDKLLNQTHTRFGPYIHDHPKAVHFSSLLKQEDQYYADEACVWLFDAQDRLAELSKMRQKLDELFLSQLRIAGDEEAADRLLQDLENERLQLATARCRFTAFGLGIEQLFQQMQQAARGIREEDDEHDQETRRLAALIMRIVRLERPNIRLYVPSAL